MTVSFAYRLAVPVNLRNKHRDTLGNDAVATMKIMSMNDIHSQREMCSALRLL